MRISTTQMQDRSVATMLDRQAELSKTQQQVASGKRILSPSDDVLGTTQVLALQELIATHKQFDENANAAEARINQEEASLTSTIDALQRVRDLAIQANGSSMTAEGRASIAVEIRAILDNVRSIANTADANGEYLFSGFNVDTVPFTETEVPPGSGLYTYAYTGDSGQRTVKIGESRFMPVGDPGQDVFMDVPESGGGTRNVFDTIEQFALDLEANTVTAPIIDDMSLAMRHIGSFRSKTGARLNAIDAHRALNDDIVFQGEKTLSQIQDLDYAEAASRLNLQLTGLQAAQQSFARIQNLSLFNFL